MFRADDDRAVNPVEPPAGPCAGFALDTLRCWLETRGSERYDGEPVSHLEHALQCARLAKRAGADDALVVAALLHDIGHLASGLPGTPSAAGIDDRHEALGAALLARWFPADVVEPVRLHVQAKRCLAANPSYLEALSADSRRSLALQGGPMDDGERVCFAALPHAKQALRLRRWDDAAKQPHAALPTLDACWAVVRRVARAG